MAGSDDRWEHARRRLIGRWQQILEYVHTRDEGSILDLANEMDEFCDEAILTREAAAGAGAFPVERGTKLGTANLAGSRCLFCRGFAETGGCLGLVHAINQAVLAGDWPAAERLARDYLDQLKGMDFQKVRTAGTSTG